MISGLELENFRSFGTRARVPLRAITLVLGQNSAGKSSLLHALTLLKQTRDSREIGAALLPRAEGGVVDLGSFNELLFDHDQKRTLHIAVECEVGDPTMRWRRIARYWGFPVTRLAVDLGFSRSAEDGEVRLAGFDLSVHGFSESIATYQRHRPTSEERRYLSHRWRVMGDSRTLRGERVEMARCVSVSSEDRLWEPTYRAWKAQRAPIREGLEKLRALNNVEDVLVETEDGPITVEAQREKNRAIGDAIQFFSSDFGLEAFRERVTASLLDSAVALENFVPSSSLVQRNRLPEWMLTRAFGLAVGGRPLDLPVLDIGQLAGFAGQQLDLALEQLFPMGPWRRPPQRWYIFTGTSPRDVGYQGEMLPDLLFRQPALVKNANNWLKKLELGYSLVVRPVGERSSDLFEVRLEDAYRTSPVDVALPDVGFGVSQVLPFVVQCLATKNRLISIEQPEVHVHPKLQADLGELLAEAIREPYGHRFLIETHSEHLVLRIQRLVRSGVLKPTDVSFVFVARGAEGSYTQVVDIDADGDFITEWPGGFFPERLRELR
jgi:predicted ATPase